jgi:hypothetical protein
VRHGTGLRDQGRTGHRDRVLDRPAAAQDRPHRGARGTGNRGQRVLRRAATAAAPPDRRTPRGGPVRVHLPPSRWADHRPADPDHPVAAGRDRPARQPGCRKVTAGSTAAGAARRGRHPTATSDRRRRTYRERRGHPARRGRPGHRAGQGPGERSVHRTARSDPAAGTAEREPRRDGPRTGSAARPAGRRRSADRGHPVDRDPAGRADHREPADRAHRDHDQEGPTAERRGYLDRTARHPAGSVPNRRRTAGGWDWGWHQAAAPASADPSHPHRASRPSPAGAGRPVGSAATSRPPVRARHGAEAAADHPGAGRRHQRHQHLHRRRPQRQPHARGSRGASWDDPCCHSS